jgi:hypothetical protein
MLVYVLADNGNFTNNLKVYRYIYVMAILTSMTALITTLAGLGFLGQLSFLQYIPIILLRIAGYSKFSIRNDRDRVKGALKLLNESTRSSSSVFEYGKTRPSGVFIGWKCFGYYIDSGKEGDADTEIIIFTSEGYFKELLEKTITPCEALCLSNGSILPTSKGKGGEFTVDVWNRRGSYTSIYYTPFKINLANIFPIGDQPRVVEDIVYQYKRNKRLTVFLHGVTGAGKSTVGILVAKGLRGSYCHDFNPTEPGDTFMNFLRDTRREDVEQGPIVIVMEEIDTTIHSVHTGGILRHKNITTSVQNKATFNTFLDDMVFHSKVVVIMTSNVSKEEIDKLDTSYLRAGRVNAYYSMMHPIQPA